MHNMIVLLRLLEYVKDGLQEILDMSFLSLEVRKLLRYNKILC